MRNKGLKEVDKTTIKLLTEKVTNIEFLLKQILQELKREQNFSQNSNYSQVEIIKDLPEHNKLVISKIDELEEDNFEQEELEVVYLSRPREDGTFSDSSRLDIFDPNRSTYKFFIRKEKKNQSYFEVINNEKNLILAKTSQETFIDPVCEKMNVLTEVMTSINTERKGVAILENGRWNVTKRAVIRFV